MAINSSFSTSHAAALAGQPARPDCTFDTGVASAAIGAGLFVCLDDAAVPSSSDPYNKPVRVPASSADVTGNRGFGFAVRASVDSVSKDYVAGDVLACVSEGEIWVTTEVAVVPGDPVFVRYAGTGTKGAVRKSDPGSEAAQLAGARFTSTAGIGGLAKVEIQG